MVIFPSITRLLLVHSKKCATLLKLFMLSVGTAWVQAYHSTERLGIYYFKGIAYSLSYLRTTVYYR